MRTNLGLPLAHFYVRRLFPQFPCGFYRGPAPCGLFLGGRWVYGQGRVACPGSSTVATRSGVARPSFLHGGFREPSPQPALVEGTCLSFNFLKPVVNTDTSGPCHLFWNLEPKSSRLRSRPKLAFSFPKLL